MQIVVAHSQEALNIHDDLQGSGFYINYHNEPFEYYPSDVIILSLSCSCDQVTVENPNVECKGHELRSKWQAKDPHHFKFTLSGKRPKKLVFCLQVIVHEKVQLSLRFCHNEEKTRENIPILVNCCGQSKISSMNCYI